MGDMFRHVPEFGMQTGKEERLPPWWRIPEADRPPIRQGVGSEVANVALILATLLVCAAIAALAI
jgi:hypothetical protein